MASKKELYKQVADYFQMTRPIAEPELIYSNAYELLVAVILSAQCTDKRVNQITPALLKRYSTPDELAKSTPDEVFAYIKSCSYPNSKAKHLVGMAQTLVDEFDGVVPADIELLQKLPGVGRKTANVIASVIFNQPTMAVDTHVFRVSHRIGLVDDSAKTPLAVEQELTHNFPQDIIPKAHHWLILHGRYICTARKPKCEECGLTKICKEYQIQRKEP